MVDLAPEEIASLATIIPALTERAYLGGGRTVSDEEHERMLSEPGLVYTPGRTFGSRHYVFRRTNLPCVRCGDTVRQQRQVTARAGDDEKTRITYFCPTCQRTSAPPKPAARRARKG